MYKMFYYFSMFILRYAPPRKESLNAVFYHHLTRKKRET